METNQAPLHRIGPIQLAAGATPGQVAIFLVVITITAVMFQFVSVIQPYLYSEVMHVPTGKQGQLTGLLQMVQYAAVALFIIPAGTLCDRFGRRPFLIAAMIGFVIVLLLLPFCAALIAMVLTRFLFGFASTGHTTGGATMMVDFPTNASRGKFIALMLVVQSIAGAALVGWLLPQAPAFFVAHGFDKVGAVRLSLWGLALFGVLGILIAVIWLRAPPHQDYGSSAPKGWRGVLESAREVLALSRADPAFGLVVLIAFVIRSDYFVTASFTTVWVMNVSRQHGIDAPTALKTVGMLQVILQITFALSPLLFGFVADRVNRVGLLIGTLVFAAIVFASSTLVHDVTGLGMMAFVALMGLSETGQTVASQAVFGDRAPPRLRGSAMGFFVLMGTISVIVVSFFAGILFDKVGYTAPFLFLGALNIVFAIGATFLVIRQKGRGASGKATVTV